jgi:DnaJ like chaperone protein
VYDPDSPYEVLGVSPAASDAEIKTRYRELAREHHPDLLVSKGLPEEFLAASGRRLAAVNEAYETIIAERAKTASRRLERAP